MLACLVVAGPFLILALAWLVVETPRVVAALPTEGGRQ